MIQTQSTTEGWQFHFSPMLMRFNALKLILSGCRGIFYEYNKPIERDEYEALLNYALELVDVVDKVRGSNTKGE